MIVFVDASAWIALVNRRDQYHQEASAILDWLRRQRAQFVTTNWTSYEARSVSKARVGPTAAKMLWERLSNPAYVRLIRVDPAIEVEALRLLLAYDDKTWGVVDCASLVLMERVGCQHVFGFDEHFVEASRQRGFTLVPPPTRQ